MGARVSVTNWRWMRDDGGASTPLSFELVPGESVLLRGRSGAGKSSLLAAIAGLAGHNAESRSPDGASFVGVVTEGSIRLDGDEVSHNGRGSGAVGLLLQDPLTQAVMSRIGDDVAFGLENLGVDPADMPERIRTALDSVALNLPLDTPTDKLSGGQRQRLALAGVLAMRPSLLLLDEPTANLDPEGARLIRQAVERAVGEHGLTLIVVDHTPGFWNDVVEREIELTAADDDVSVTSATSATVPSPTHVPTKRPTATVARATSLAVGYPRAPLAQRELSFEVVAGRILVVSGPNGAGKSALALTLAQLIPARGGELTFVQKKPRIGLVFQTPEHQFIGATVRADVSAGFRAKRRTSRTSRTTTRLEREDRVDGTLQEFRLETLAHRHPFALSGGEKRRLSIADVVVTADADEPSILIFDEPSTGQDEQSWHDLVESLRGLARVGHALVVITHDERLATAIGDDRLELKP